jgi:hypothetical protein
MYLEKPKRIVIWTEGVAFVTTLIKQLDIQSGEYTRTHYVTVLANEIFVGQDKAFLVIRHTTSLDKFVKGKQIHQNATIFNT